MLELRCERAGGRDHPVRLVDYRCFAAGYTGRNQAAVREHVRELELEGVAPPAHVPACFPLLPGLVVTDLDAIDVYGRHTGGEIEPVLIVIDGAVRYVGVGSDHTDRELEETSIPHSKQLCAKVLSGVVWAFEDVRDRWDELVLRSRSDGEPYQEGTLASLLPVEGLVAAVPAARRAPAMIVFGGTLPTSGGLRTGSRFEGELIDPSGDRSLAIGYDVRVVEPIS